VIHYRPQPPTLEETLLFLQPAAAVAGPLQLLSMEEITLWRLTLEHRLRMQGLDEARSAHAGGFPGEPSGDGDAEARSRAVSDYGDWIEIDEELQLLTIQEDCCFHLPLDHQFGEIENDRRDLYHWEEAGKQGSGEAGKPEGVD
jgi:hypothetical protein